MTTPASRDLHLLGRQLEREPSDAEIDAMSGPDLVRAAFGDSPTRRNALRRKLIAEVNVQHRADVEAALGGYESEE